MKKIIKYKKLVIVTLIFCLLIFFIFLKISKHPSIKQIAEKIHVELPSNTSQLFYKRVIGLTSEVIYIKLRVDKIIWINLIKNKIFKDAKEGGIGNNAFSPVEIRYKDWEPQNVKKSISGTYFIKNSIRKQITYLFDIQNESWVDCYFAVYQE